MLHVGWDRSFSVNRGRHLILFGAPFALMVAAWLGFFRTTYGTFNPAAPYGDRVPLEMGQIASGLLGLMTDQEFGLIPHAPVHLLWLVGLWSVFRRHARLGVELLLLVGPYAIAASAFPMWWAGSSAPARFLVRLSSRWACGCECVGATSTRESDQPDAAGASVMIATAVGFGGDGWLA
jgi:hypothetical protein